MKFLFWIKKHPVRTLFLLFAANLLLMILSWNRVAIDVSPEVANGTINHRFQIPEFASHVSFWSTPRESQVTFEIDEAGYHRWIDSMGFRSVAIKDTMLGSRVILDKNGRHKHVIVESGENFSSDGECFIRGSYDRNAQICSAFFGCK